MIFVENNSAKIVHT